MISLAGAPSPTGMVTTGILPSRDTCTSLHIVGEGREQDAEASPARIAARRRSYSKIFCASVVSRLVMFCIFCPVPAGEPAFLRS
jgi:hypothetical protein